MSQPANNQQPEAFRCTLVSCEEPAPENAILSALQFLLNLPAAATPREEAA